MKTQTLFNLLIVLLFLVTGCGANSPQQINDPKKVNDNLILASVQQPSPFAANWEHVLFVDKNNNLFGWGSNQSNRLGLGSSSSPATAYIYTNYPNPTFLPHSSNVKAVATGNAHSLILKNDSTVWSLGDNSVGQLGDGTKQNHLIPVQVVGLSNVKAISASWTHSWAVKNDGTLWWWGARLRSESSVPIQVTALRDVEAVAAGHGSSLVLKTDGSVWKWDWSSDPFNPIPPSQIPNLNNVIAIAARDSEEPSYIVVRSDGTVWSWGDNSSGQLGDGTTVSRPNPAPIIGLDNVKAVSLSDHILALKNDGTLWAWGWNSFGQLGNGTQQDHLTPIQVTGLSNVAAMVAGTGYSLALLEDCSLWSWGADHNGRGVLADGVSSSHMHTTPQRVSSLPCNATNTDFDDDGISNDIEYQHTCLDPFAPDASIDFDGDGLTNEEEIDLHTNPCKADSDSDSVNDGNDNCPLQANANQNDFDRDGLGDICDYDADNDGCNKVFDTNDLDPNVWCAVRPLDPAFDRKGRLLTLDPRLDDPRIRVFIDSTIPDLDPICGQLDCPPPLLTIFDQEFTKPLLVIEADSYGFSGEDGFGYAAQILPDIDGNDIGEIAIAAPLANDKAGIITIISGNTGEELNRLKGDTLDGMLGASLALLDKNTLAVGALGSSTIYLVNLNNFEVEQSFSSESKDGFGFALATLGDLDKDGVAELAVGAPYAEDNKGSVYIAYSGGDLQRLANGRGQGEQFGYALTSTDINNDGLPDLLIGSPEAIEGKGEVRAISITGKELWNQQGQEYGEHLGFALASHIDKSGAKILVGAPGWQDNTGRVYVLESNGNVSGHTSAGKEGAQLGTSVAFTSDGKGITYLVEFAPYIEGKSSSYFYEIP